MTIGATYKRGVGFNYLARDNRGALNHVVLVE